MGSKVIEDLRQGFTPIGTRGWIITILMAVAWVLGYLLLRFRYNPEPERDPTMGRDLAGVYVAVSIFVLLAGVASALGGGTRG